MTNMSFDYKDVAQKWSLRRDHSMAKEVTQKLVKNISLCVVVDLGRH